MGVEVYQSVTPPDLFVDSEYTLAANVAWFTPDQHWQGGIQWEADCSEVAATLMECISGAPSPNSTKTSTYARLFRGARPFTVYAEVDCAPTSEWWQEGQTRVLRALAKSGPTQMEKTFWTGVAITGTGALVYPNLTSTGPIFDSTGRILLQPAATVISGAPLDIVEGMSRLEKTFGDCYDGVGWVHVPSNLIQPLYARNQCYEKNGKLYTSRGNIVVIGDGYSSNIGPGNAAAPGGSGWLAMTSPVFGIRGTPRTFTATQSFDRNVDTYKVLAEQTVLLGWDCCLVNVLVTTGGEQAGEPGAATQDT